MCEQFSHNVLLQQLVHLNSQAEAGDGASAFSLYLIYKSDHSLPNNQLIARNYLNRAVDLEYPEAYFTFAKYFVNSCPEKYFLYLKKAADLQHTEASFLTFKCYSQGFGTKPNPVLAFRYLFLPAERGHILASYHLGMSYKHGRGCESNQDQAFLYFSKAKNLGHVESTYECGIYHHEKKEFSSAFNCFKQCVLYNHLNSKFKLAICLFYGLGTNQNYERSFELFKECCESNISGSFYFLSKSFYQGLGTPIDCKLAFLTALKGSSFNESNCSYLLGKFYEEGIGVGKDAKISIEFFKKAADSGHLNSMIKLAFLFQIRDASHQKIAFNYLTSAALLGSSFAKFSLGNFYAKGIGTDISLEKAFDCYLEAGADGFVKSFVSIGKCFIKGLGVERNRDQGIDWFKKGVESRDADCIYELALEIDHSNSENLSQIFDLLSVSALELNHGPSLHQLALFLFHNPTITADLNPIKLLEKGSLISNSDCCFELGNCYEKGLYVNQSVLIALKYYIQSAKLYHAIGSLRAGLLLKNQNRNDCFYFFLRSAQLNNPQACFETGLCFYKGFGIEKNYNEAFNFFLKSFELNYFPCTLILARCFHFGIGCLVDYNRAFEFYKKAHEGGDPGGSLGYAHALLDGLGCEKNEKDAYLLFKNLAENFNSPEAKRMISYYFDSGIVVSRDPIKSLLISSEVNLDETLEFCSNRNCK
ncbi:hypothetical protein RCL1_004121 [Eukaryota sp. TZLM3-RCL]